MRATQIFLLVASVSVPAVSAETQAYYELHNMCLCNAEEDLGHVKNLNWGIGYKAWIDKQTDNWKVFVHAGDATKEITITPETEDRTVVTLKDFVNAVKECKTESDQIPINARDSLLYGIGGSIATVGGALYDNAPAVGLDWPV